MAEHFGAEEYDDLTIGLDEEEDLHVDDWDLLKPPEKESPLAHLKSIVVGLDWEITDESLFALNDEVLVLRDLWGDEKIYLVYLQLLEYLSKYIYQKKSGAHPDAIKLLPLFFHNLENILSSSSDLDGKIVLKKDVVRFEKLKSDIIHYNLPGVDRHKDFDSLKKLKALVLGMDWEITETNLAEARTEVLNLENTFKTNHPALILLQSIGFLISYIQSNVSEANVASFSLVHDFYNSLEKILSGNIPEEESKELLQVNVDKLNGFKNNIADMESGSTLQSMDPALVPNCPPIGEEQITGGDKMSSLSSSDEIENETDVALDSLFNDPCFLEDNLSDPMSGVDVEIDGDELISLPEEKLATDDESIEIQLMQSGSDSDSIILNDDGGDSENTFDVDSCIDAVLNTELDDILLTDIDPLSGVNVETEDDEFDEEDAEIEEGLLVGAVAGISTDQLEDDKEMNISSLHDTFSEKLEENSAETKNDSSLSFLVDDLVGDLSNPESDFENVSSDDSSISTFLDLSFEDDPEGLTENLDLDSISSEESSIGTFLDLSFEDDSEEEGALSEDISIDDVIVDELAPALSFLEAEEEISQEDEIVSPVLTHDSDLINSAIDALFDDSEEHKDSLDIEEEVDEIDVLGDFFDDDVLEDNDHSEEITQSNESNIFVNTAGEEVINTVIEEEPSVIPKVEAILDDVIVENDLANNINDTDDLSYLVHNLNGSVSSLSYEYTDDISCIIIDDLVALKEKQNIDTSIKFLLQLMTPVANHINQYGYNSHRKAYSLLARVAKELDSKAEDMQQVLLLLTTEVLEWQQDIISSKSDIPNIVKVDVTESVKETAEAEFLRIEVKDLRRTIQGEISRLRSEMIIA